MSNIVASLLTFDYPTNEIYAGRVIPQGFFSVQHRDSWAADSAFYIRCFAFAIFFILLRIFVVSPFVLRLSKTLNITKPSHLPKLSESIMQSSFYTFAWLYNVWFLIKQDWFWNPLICFLDNFPRQTVEPEIAFFYSLQIGWYMHGVYTHFFLDTKKSDFAIMIVHHATALSLLFFAFVVGYFRVGMLVTFSMDVCDIFLYSAMILKVINSGGKVDYPLAVYYVGFGMIPITWFFFRLVYMPFVVMRTTAYDTVKASGWDQADGGLLFNVLLFILLCLNVWWFAIITKIMVQSILTQSVQALDDTREKSNAKVDAYSDEKPRENAVPKKRE